MDAKHVLTQLEDEKVILTRMNGRVPTKLRLNSDWLRILRKPVGAKANQEVAEVLGMKLQVIPSSNTQLILFKIA